MPMLSLNCSWSYETELLVIIYQKIHTNTINSDIDNFLWSQYQKIFQAELLPNYET